MIDLGEGVQLITRAEWGAAVPRLRTPLVPSFGSTRHWEGPHMGWPWPHGSCFTKVRGIQAFHMGPSRGWSDIAYTSLVCPHGFVFQGRWVGVRTAANGTNVGNNSAYANCYLGGERDGFTPEGRHAMHVVEGWLDVNGGAGPGVNCHRDWKPTACPGDEICADVGSNPPGPTPPTPEVNFDMAHIVRRAGDGSGKVYLIDGDYRRWLNTGQAVKNAVAALGPAVRHGGITAAGDVVPLVWDTGIVDLYPPLRPGPDD